MNGPEKEAARATDPGQTTQTPEKIPPIVPDGKATDPPEPDQGDRGGWTAIGDADADIIRRAHPENSPTILAAWYWLAREARYRRSLTFRLADSILADRCGVHRHTAVMARKALSACNLLGFQAGHDAGTRLRTAVVYTLTPHVSPVRCPTTGQPLANGSTSLANDDPPMVGQTLRVHRGEYTPDAHSKRENDRQKRRAAAAKPPPTAAGIPSTEKRNAEQGTGPVDKSVPDFMRNTKG